MLHSTTNQAYVFLSTLYAGLIIGFLYDCCRMVRKMIRAGVIITGILDLLFWAVIGILSFLVLFYVDNGSVRLYTVVGLLIGWLLYRLTLSPFIMKALDWIYKTLADFLHWLGKILLWPVRVIWMGLARIFGGLTKGAALVKKGLSGIFQGFLKKTIKKTAD